MKKLEMSDVKLMEFRCNGGSALHSAVFTSRLREILQEFYDELETRERISRQDCDNARKVKDSTEEKIQAGMVMALVFMKDKLNKKFAVLFRESYRQNDMKEGTVITPQRYDKEVEL